MAIENNVYYLSRANAARRMAAQAVSPNAARIHGAMADAYEALISPPPRVETRAGANLDA